MTNYINPRTRIGGVEQIVVPKRQPAMSDDADAPVDGTQYVRLDGEWVPINFPAVVKDTLAPSPPTGLSSIRTVTSDPAWVDYQLSWVAPTTNVNSSPLTDFSYYVVRWRYQSSSSWATLISIDPGTFLPGLVQHTGIAWQVLARDISGNDSTWSPEAT